MPSDTIVIAADHAGFEMKAMLKDELARLGRGVLDLGTDSAASVDYPDFADRLAAALADGRDARGILVCGTGIGIAMAANRHRHVRAAVCHNTSDARLARQHNDANVMAVGSRVIGPEVARDCVAVFLDTKFEGGRHAGRVAKMS